MVKSLKENISLLFADINTIPSFFSQPYFSSLDGFRAISIIMVVAFHLNLSSNHFINLLCNGGLGVNIFFIISGFLITTLLIKEKIRTKNISLKRFYIRRFLRIFPVAYLYLLVVILLNYIFKLDISPIILVASALYIINFSYFRSHYFTWYTGHFWSLSVEEQFYIFFPIILKKNMRFFTWIIIFIIFGLPLIILLQYNVAMFNKGILYGVTHYLIKFQSIAVGCFFSVLCMKNIINLDSIRKYKIVLNIVGFAAIFYIGFNEVLSLVSMFKNLLIALITGMLIVSNLAESKDWIFRFLNFKWMKQIGILSYSIYIWQQIFTSSDKRLPIFMIKTPYNIIAIIITASLSYYLFEKKFLKLKDKFKFETK